MSEGKQKRNYYDKEIVDKLVEEFGLTPRFIRKAISGDNKSLTADKVKARFKELTAALEAALKSI